MNILIINGSPRGESSNSLKLARAFVSGMHSTADTEYELDISKLDIRSCLGCFGCWHKTPGKCCIPDDMGDVLDRIIHADVIVWSFPLYCYSVPGKLKILIDRNLPMVMPELIDRSDGFGNGSHPSRYPDRRTRNVVISTCGFWTANGNYDGVDSLFSHMCGIDNFEKIYCGEGELFRVRELDRITGPYLETVRRAGKEYAEGGISAETRRQLASPLLPRQVFEDMANSHSRK